MALTPKQWKDTPDTTTPLSAAALVDLEQRLSAYTDSESATKANTADTRFPAGADIVNADIDAVAAIAESKLNLASDASAGTASRRTLGTGANQAAAGNDSRFGSGGSTAIRDEGTLLTQRSALNFAGAGVTATDDATNSRTLITIPGAGSSASSMAVNVKDYAALGDGTTDDTTAIDSAIAAAAGRMLYFPVGRYIRNTSINLGTVLGIVGDGPGLSTLIFPSSVHGVTCAGSLSPSLTLAADATRGNTTLSLSSTAGLAPGDSINISSNEVSHPNTSNPSTARKGEMARIFSVSGTTLTLMSPINDAYPTTQGPKVRKVDWVESPTLRGVGMEQASQSATAGLPLVKLSLCRDARVNDCKFMNFDGGAVSLISSIDAVIDGITMVNGYDRAVNNQYGYGVSLYGACHDIRFVNSYMKRGRHMYTGGGANTGFPRHVLVANCQATEMTASSFDTHPDEQYVHFVGCVARGAADAPSVHKNIYGFQIRGQYCSVKACSAFDVYECGLTVRETAIDTEVVGFRATRIRSNANAGGRGMEISGKNTTVVGFHVEDCDYRSITINNSPENVFIRGMNSRAFDAHIEVSGATVSGALTVEGIFHGGTDPFWNNGGTLPAVVSIQAYQIGTTKNTNPELKRLPPVGNSVASTTLGAQTRKMEVYDGLGNSLGFIPIYAS